MAPPGVRGVGRGQVERGLLTVPAPDLAANHVDGTATGHRVEPGREKGIGFHVGGVAGEFDEDLLGHLLGEMRAAHLAEGGGVNQVEMAGDQGGKGRFGMPVGVALQQLVIGGIHGLA